MNRTKRSDGALAGVATSGAHARLASLIIENVPVLKLDEFVKELDDLAIAGGAGSLIFARTAAEIRRMLK